MTKAKSVLTLLIRTIFNILIGFVITGKIITDLGEESFGFATTILAIIFFAALFNNGLSITNQKYFAEIAKQNDTQIASRMMKSLVLINLSYSALSLIILLALNIYYKLGIVYLVIAAIYIVSSYLFSFFTQHVNISQKFSVYYEATMYEFIFKLLFFFFIKQVEVDIVLYFIYLIVPMIITIVFFYRKVFRNTHNVLSVIRINGSNEYFINILNNSINNSYLSIFAAIKGQVPTLALQYFGGISLLGYRGILSYLQTSIIQVLSVGQTVMSSYVFRGSSENSRLLKENLLLNWMSGILVCCATILCGDLFLEFWLGDEGKSELLLSWFSCLSIVILFDYSGQAIMIKIQQIGNLKLYVRAEGIFVITSYIVPLLYFSDYVVNNNLYFFLASAAALNFLCKLIVLAYIDRPLYRETQSLLVSITSINIFIYGLVIWAFKT